VGGVMLTRIRVIEIETDDAGVLDNALALLGATRPATLSLPAKREPDAKAEDIPSAMSAPGREEDPNPPPPSSPLGTPATDEGDDNPVVETGAHSSAVKPEKAKFKKLVCAKCGRHSASNDHRRICLGQGPRSGARKAIPAPPLPSNSDTETASTPPAGAAAEEPEPSEPQWPAHSGDGHERGAFKLSAGYRVYGCSEDGCPWISVEAATRERRVDFYSVCASCKQWRNSMEHLVSCIAGPKLVLA
jgi:hypothetical protein